MNANNLNPDKTPGIACPCCGQLIRTSVHELLFFSSLRCSNCNLQLMIDRQQSRTALEALAKVDMAQKKVERAQIFNR